MCKRILSLTVALMCVLFVFTGCMGGVSDPSRANLSEKKLTDDQLKEMVDGGQLSAGVTNVSLDRNQLSDVNPLKALTSVETLILSNNQIADVSFAASLVNLKQLHLFGNQIADVAPLAALTKLEVLDLGNNRIGDVAPLKALSGLKELWLDGNPLDQTQVDELRQTLPGCKISFR